MRKFSQTGHQSIFRTIFTLNFSTKCIEVSSYSPIHRSNKVSSELFGEKEKLKAHLIL
jgi:hypothetical protein